MSRRRRDPIVILRDSPLQQHVLLVLSTRGDATIPDWSAWWPLAESQVRGAIARLGRHGFVDATGWNDGARLYGITTAGQEALDALFPADADPEALLEQMGSET